MQVLLVEPNYCNKYPPLGLMKISHFLKSRDHDVLFYKGCSEEIRDEFDWDYILVTSLFTFEWDITVETIRFYQKNSSNAHVACGGILASLMPNELKKATGVHVVEGLLNRTDTFGIDGEEEIESHIPDYALLDDIDYEYPVADSYFVYFTRGCVNKCGFCAVPKLEPEYEVYRPALQQIKMIDKEYGPKQNLLVMDNNTVASPCFDKIINDIKMAGFYTGAKLNGKQRHIDFNQGVDARELTEEKMSLLSGIAIKPLRIAFDDINLKDKYIECMQWAAKYGLTQLSNYVLYNYRDTPVDFYQRLGLNIELNEQLGTSIYSFPMKYSPIFQTHRNYIGKHWNWRYLRSVKCILQATHGVVSPKKEFFLRAFGTDPDDFISIISMPEKYIIDRTYNEEVSTQWRLDLKALDITSRREFEKRATQSKNPKFGSENEEVERLLSHFV